MKKDIGEMVIFNDPGTSNKRPHQDQKISPATDYAGKQSVSLFSTAVARTVPTRQRTILFQSPKSKCPLLLVRRLFSER